MQVYIILLSVSFWYGKVITTGWLEKISFNSTFWICERGIFLNGLVLTGRVMSRLHGPCSELGRGGWNLQNPPPETTQPVEPTNRRGTEVLLTLWAHILGGGGPPEKERERRESERVKRSSWRPGLVVWTFVEWILILRDCSDWTALFLQKCWLCDIFSELFSELFSGTWTCEQ